MQSKKYLAILLIHDPTNLVSDTDIQWAANPSIFQMNIDIWNKILKIDPDILCIRVQHDRTLTSGTYMFDTETHILKVSHSGIPSYGHTDYAMNITLNAFDIVRKLFEYDFIIRSTTSSFWILHRLKTLLHSLPKTRLYKGSKQFHDGITGSGFILSKDVVDVFLDHQEYLRSSTVADDVTFSNLAKVLNIPLEDMSICNIEFPKTSNIDEMIRTTDACHFRVKSDYERLQIDTIIFNKIYHYFYTFSRQVSLVGWHHEADYSCIKSNENVEIYHSNTISDNNVKKIYIQPEPDCICNIKQHLEKNHNKYDYILCFDTKTFNYPNVIPLLYGSTWIEKTDYLNIDRNIKEYKISSLCGTKNWTIGHSLRIALFMNQLQLSRFPLEIFRTPPDGHGTLNNQILPDINNNKLIRAEHSAKIDLFKTFQFSIVIENCREYGYFSEKIVDCLITKTIPIYYGCENIGDYFNTDGWILLQTNDIISELNEKLELLNESYYNNYTSVIEENYHKAIQYSSTMENIYKSIAKIPYIRISK